MSADAAPRLPDKGLGLALEILEQVARSPAGATAAEIARGVGAPRASVYRVVNALVRDEFLVRRPDLSGFLLGTRVLELASLVEAQRTAAPERANSSPVEPAALLHAAPLPTGQDQPA